MHNRCEVSEMLICLKSNWFKGRRASSKDSLCERLEDGNCLKRYCCSTTSTWF